MRGIEQLAMVGLAAAAGAAVQINRRHAVGIACGFDVKLMTVADRQHLRGQRRIRIGASVRLRSAGVRHYRVNSSAAPSPSPQRVSGAYQACVKARRGRAAAPGEADDAGYLQVAQAYILISMPTGSSTIFGVFQVISCLRPRAGPMAGFQIVYDDFARKPSKSGAPTPRRGRECRVAAIALVKAGVLRRGWQSARKRRNPRRAAGKTAIRKRELAHGRTVASSGDRTGGADPCAKGVGGGGDDGGAGAARGGQPEDQRGGRSPSGGRPEAGGGDRPGACRRPRSRHSAGVP